MANTRRRIVVPVTFITAGSSTPLDTSTHRYTRKWRANIAFIDALELASVIIADLLGIRLGSVTATATAQAITGKYDDGETYDFSEDT